MEAPDELVLERSLARRLGVEPGDGISVQTTDGLRIFTVAGLAVVPSGEPYPESQPGLAFLSREGIALIQPDETGLRWIEAVRLADAEAVRAFELQAAGLFEPGTVFFDDWRDQRADATERNRTTAIVLSTFSVILLVAVGFVLGVLVGSRVVARYREIGLLKAVGLTPAQVSALFLVEQLALGLVGALAGVAGGAVLTPALVKSSAELVGGVPVEVSPVRLVVAVLVVEAVIAVVTVLASLRGSRFTVVHALAAGGGRSAQSGLGRLAGLREPLPLWLGVKDALARPGRAIATTLALALAVGSLVAGLAMEATIRHEERVEAVQQASEALPADPAGLAPSRPDPVVVGDLGRQQIRPVVHGLNGLLVAVAIANLLAVALLAVRERVRDLGVLRAVGLTPRQVTGSVLAGHGALGVLAALIGIPLGLALFFGVYGLANGDTELARLPAWWALALVPLGTAAAVAAVAALPARRAGRLTVVESLRYE